MVFSQPFKAKIGINLKIRPSTNAAFTKIIGHSSCKNFTHEF